MSGSVILPDFRVGSQHTGSTPSINNTLVGGPSVPFVSTVAPHVQFVNAVKPAVIDFRSVVQRSSFKFRGAGRRFIPHLRVDYFLAQFVRHFRPPVN